MRSILIVIVGIAVIFCPVVARTGEKEAFEALGGNFRAYDHELPYLPPYCRYCAAINKYRYKHEKEKWQRVLKSKGKPMHLHHYCFGLIMLNRLSRGVGKRSALLKRAESQFDYVIRHSRPDFVLLPEVYLKMGVTQQLIGKDAEALKYFIKATKLKKNYVPAYIRIIDYYKGYGDAKNAIRVARLGLKYSPNSSALKKELSQLRSLSQ